VSFAKPVGSAINTPAPTSVSGGTPIEEKSIEREPPVPSAKYRPSSVPLPAPPNGQVLSTAQIPTIQSSSLSFQPMASSTDSPPRIAALSAANSGAPKP